MNGILAVLLCNLLVASVIAVLGLAAGRWSRRPALTHGLWLLFFLKLLTPPLFPVEIRWDLPDQVQAPAKQSQADELPPALVEDRREEIAGEAAPAWGELAEVRADQAGAVAPLVEPTAVESESGALPRASEAVAWSWDLPWEQAAAGLWLTGSLSWLSLAGARLLRFRKQLRFAQPAPARLQMEARRLAGRLRVTCPGVWLMPGAVSPMLWVLGSTPRLLIPGGLLERLDDVQRQALLVHELAHWRRRDHWVRWLELAVLGVYWWCPLVWWARGQLQEAEEECCDAWVVWMLPGAARCYALALVETLDFVASARAVLPPAASGIGHVRLLQRRLTMIMRGTTPRTLTLSGGLAVLALGALLLPLVPSWAQTPATATQGVDRPDPKPRDPFAERAQAGERGQQADPNARDAFRDKVQALEKAQQDIRRIQEELDRARQDLERRTQELNVKIDQVKRAAAETAKAVERKAGSAREARRGRQAFPWARRRCHWRRRWLWGRPRRVWWRRRFCSRSRRVRWYWYGRTSSGRRGQASARDGAQTRYAHQHDAPGRPARAPGALAPAPPGVPMRQGQPKQPNAPDTVRPATPAAGPAAPEAPAAPVDPASNFDVQPSAAPRGRSPSYQQPLAKP